MLTKLKALLKILRTDIVKVVKIMNEELKPLIKLIYDSVVTNETCH